MLAILLQAAEITTVPATGATAVDFTLLFIKMLLVLGVVTVAAVLILKYAVPQLGLMKRFQQGKYFTVLGRYTLEHRKSLYLVQTGKKYLVIGVADHAINLITELSEAEARGMGEK